MTTPSEAAKGLAHQLFGDGLPEDEAKVIASFLTTYTAEKDKTIAELEARVNCFDTDYHALALDWKAAMEDKESAEAKLCASEAECAELTNTVELYAITANRLVDRASNAEKALAEKTAQFDGCNAMLKDALRRNEEYVAEWQGYLAAAQERIKILEGI